MSLDVLEMGFKDKNSLVIHDVKECSLKAAKKREREEEREIIRKIKAEDKAVEDFKKYNIKVVY